MPSIPSHDRWSRCAMTPRRSPCPFTVESAKERGEIWYRTPARHHGDAPASGADAGMGGRLANGLGCAGSRPLAQTLSMAIAGEDQRAMRRPRMGVTAAFAAHAVLSGLLGPWVPRIRPRRGWVLPGPGSA